MRTEKVAPLMLIGDPSGRVILPTIYPGLLVDLATAPALDAADPLELLELLSELLLRPQPQRPVLRIDKSTMIRGARAGVFCMEALLKVEMREHCPGNRGK